jgi:hypothetical protein
MKFVKLSQNLRKYALNVRSVTLGYAHMKKINFLHSCNFYYNELAFELEYYNYFNQGIRNRSRI